MHKILEFILAVTIIMSVLVATDYIVRIYVSSSQVPSKYLRESIDLVANAVTDYILETPGVPKNWNQLVRAAPPVRVGLSFVNTSNIVNPLKIIRLMVCNKTLNPYYINPLLNVTKFSRILTGSSNYGIRISLRRYFNIKLFKENNYVYLNVSNYLIGAKAYILSVLKCRSGSIYYLNMTTTTIQISNLSSVVLTYNPLSCNLISVTAIISKNRISTITYLISNLSLQMLPVSYLNSLLLITLNPLPITSPKYLVNASIFYYVPNGVGTVITNITNLAITTSAIPNLVINNNIYYVYNLTLKYTPAMHTVIIEVCEKVKKGVYNTTAVYVLPLYPYLSMLCGGNYGLTPPTSGVPLTTISRSVKVGLFDYVFNVKVWVVRS